MMKMLFEIAGVRIELHTEMELKMISGFDPFLTEGEADYICEFKEVKTLPISKCDEVLFKDLIMEVRQDEKGREYRAFFGDVGDTEPYAVRFSDPEEKTIRILYLPRGRMYLNETQNAFFHIGLEDILLRENQMILHSSLVETPYGGLLFTGRSGIGKSTQADLWVKHQCGRILNGDRTIIAHDGEGYKGCGSPYAGSSRYYLNESTGVQAIIVLEQSKDNSLVRLRPVQAFCEIFKGVIVNQWNKTSTSRICDEIIALIDKVPVYRLSCTPDERAVETLLNEWRNLEGVPA